MWVLAAKLPNSDLNFAVDFWGDFFSYFIQGKRPKKIHKRIHREIHQKVSREKFPLDFCRSLLLTKKSRDGDVFVAGEANNAPIAAILRCELCATKLFCCKKGKGHQNRAPGFLEPRVVF